MVTTPTVLKRDEIIEKRSPSYSEQHRKLVALIADGLGEKPFTPAYCEINAAVNVLGGLTVLQTAQEALQIEKSGGMPRKDGKGKRTLGGVFFFLLKKRCTPAQRRRIYPQAQRPRQANETNKSVRKKV